MCSTTENWWKFDKKAEFNSLLVEFSVDLMVAEPPAMGLEIDRILETAGEFLHMDQIFLAELPDEHEKMRILHFSCGPDCGRVSLVFGFAYRNLL